jgi:hypothetical protein
VPVTRGKEQAVIFTDSKEDLLKAGQRPAEPLSVTELSEAAKEKSTPRNGVMKHLAFARGLGVFAGRNGPHQPGVGKDVTGQRGSDHER